MSIAGAQPQTGLNAREFALPITIMLRYSAKLASDYPLPMIACFLSRFLLKNAILALSVGMGLGCIVISVGVGAAIAQPESIKMTQEKQPSTVSSNPGELVRIKEAEWIKDYERYFARNFNAPLRDISSIQALLGNNARQTGKRSAVLYIVTKPQTLELVLVTPDADAVRRSFDNVSSSEIKEVIKRFRNAVSNPDATHPDDYLGPSQQLYTYLIASFSEKLKDQKIDTILFCVGAVLRSTPFAALHDGKQFLIEKFSIGLIPAFSSLDPDYQSIKNARVLAMGASEFKDLNPLPSVPQELSAIIRSQGGNSFLNSQFTVKNLTLQREKNIFTILHLATHANFQPGEVENSYLQFWDQKLSLDQLPNLRLQSPLVDLLVLSACQTALGDPHAELGFAGLAIQSGAKSVLGSLWSVSDAGTLQLMIQFYKQLKLSPIKAEALRKAQVEILRNPSFSHPYNWSAFTMIGSPW
ncbi:MAG: CHAT domain-containing protein [Thermosynechococcaceae cyanobacterium]